MSGVMATMAITPKESSSIFECSMASDAPCAKARTKVAVMGPDATLPEEALYLKMRGHVAALMQALDELGIRHAELDAMTTGTQQKAEAARDVLIPLMLACRVEAGALEEIMDDSLWPLPKYGELLWNHC